MTDIVHVAEQELFAVWIFFPDGSACKEDDGLSAEQAVLRAAAQIRKPAVHLGVITRVIITDADDCCVFEWQHGKGVMFPQRIPDEDH